MADVDYYAWLDVDPFFNANVDNMPDKAPPPGMYQPTHDVWPFPFLYHANQQGYSGLGIDWTHALSAWWAIVFAVVWLICRTIGRKYLFSRLAQWMGVKGQKKQRKFGYSLWLAIFYTASTVWAYMSFKDEKYVKFPMLQEDALHATNNYPMRMTQKERFFYLYELGFFIAELFAIFVEDRRSDFMEYLIHHVTTIILVFFSYSSYYHRNGIYILLLHDASDIFLCVAKVFHYANIDWGVYMGFTLFTTIFAYLRLYCLPIMLVAVGSTTHTNTPCHFFYWFLYSGVGFLFFLHIYWFILVIRMIFRLISGTKGDVRSDEDEDEPTAAKKKSSKAVKKKQ